MLLVRLGTWVHLLKAMLLPGFELSFLWGLFKFDPLVVTFEGFHLTLRMDWLGRYNVSLDYGQCRVIVVTIGFHRVEYRYTSPSDALLTSFAHTLEATLMEIQ